MKYNIYQLKEMPVINYCVNFKWQMRLTNDEVNQWEAEEIKNFYKAFPVGSLDEKERYLFECANIMEREFISIHLPNEL